MKYEFNASEELVTIGAIETIIHSYCNQECSVEDLYLASNICEGKIRYFSQFKKNVGMLYTHLMLVIDSVITNNLERYQVAYEEYAKAFYNVFKHLL